MKRPDQKRQKSIAELWGKLETPKQIADQEERLAQDAIDAVAHLAEDRAARPQPAAKKMGRPPKLRQHTIGTGQATATAKAAAAEAAAAALPETPIPPKRHKWWIPTLILLILKEVKLRNGFRPAVRHLLNSWPSLYGEVRGYKALDESTVRGWYFKGGNEGESEEESEEEIRGKGQNVSIRGRRRGAVVARR